MFLRLKPRSQRKLSADEVIRELQPKLSRIPGIRAYLNNPPVISVGGRVSKSQYQFTLQSTDIQALYAGATDLLARLASVPELQDVTSDLQIRNPQVRVAIDRDRAAALGVTAYQIEEALLNAYGSRQVSTILTSNDQYWVILELMPQYQRDASALALLTVRSARGVQVPLGAVAKLSPGVGPLTVNHQGQIPAVTLSFNLRPGVALGTGTAAVERAAREVLPSTITTGFFGTAQVFQASQQGLLALLVLAILVIYLVLGILYESFIHPLTILSGLPFAAFGALLTLLIFRTELTIYAYVGIIMLVGLVKKNAIMMIDFALEAERNEGKPAREAILQACSVRFRPIMMTTFAALMGTLPIAIGFGAGAESRRPLGLAVVGGLAFSQIDHALHHAGDLHLPRRVPAPPARPPARQGPVRRRPGRSRPRSSRLTVVGAPPRLVPAFDSPDPVRIGPTTQPETRMRIRSLAGLGLLLVYSVTWAQTPAPKSWRPKVEPSQPTTSTTPRTAPRGKDGKPLHYYNGIPDTGQFLPDSTVIGRIDDRAFRVARVPRALVRVVHAGPAQDRQRGALRVPEQHGQQGGARHARPRGEPAVHLRGSRQAAGDTAAHALQRRLRAPRVGLRPGHGGGGPARLRPGAPAPARAAHHHGRPRHGGTRAGRRAGRAAELAAGGEDATRPAAATRVPTATSAGWSGRTSTRSPRWRSSIWPTASSPASSRARMAGSSCRSWNGASSRRPSSTCSRGGSRSKSAR